MFTVEDDTLLAPEINSDSSTVSSSSPPKKGLLTAQDKRRISQARHRHNVAACYKNLREVLPQQDINLVPRRFTPVMNTVPPSVFPKLKNNKATVLNRAKFYMQHLESVLGMLLEEKNQTKKNGGTSDMAGPSTSFQSHSGDNLDQYNIENLTSIDDVKESFVQNFAVNKSVLDYKFGLKKTIKQEVMSSDEEEFLETELPSASSSQFTTSYPMSQSMFVPFNSPCSSHNLINPILKSSPADSNEDLGFVSAEAESQESNVVVKEELLDADENDPFVPFYFPDSSLFSQHF